MVVLLSHLTDGKARDIGFRYTFKSSLHLGIYSEILIKEIPWKRRHYI